MEKTQKQPSGPELKTSASITLGYITFSNLEEAKKISSALVENKLIACANIFEDHTAVYMWQGHPSSEMETGALIKTQAHLIPKINSYLTKYHSYDCPCLVSWELNGGNPEFLNWVKEQTLSKDEIND